MLVTGNIRTAFLLRKNRLSNLSKISHDRLDEAILPGGSGGISLNVNTRKSGKSAPPRPLYYHGISGITTTRAEFFREPNLVPFVSDT